MIFLAKGCGVAPQLDPERHSGRLWLDGFSLQAVRMSAQPQKGFGAQGCFCGDCHQGSRSPVSGERSQAKELALLHGTEAVVTRRRADLGDRSLGSDPDIFNKTPSLSESVYPLIKKNGKMNQSKAAIIKIRA